MRDTPDQYQALDRAAHASLEAAWQVVADEPPAIADGAMLGVAAIVLGVALRAGGDLSAAAVNEVWAAHGLPWRLVAVQ
jgi:hypothetical protein